MKRSWDDATKLMTDKLQYSLKFQVRLWCTFLTEHEVTNKITFSAYAQFRSWSQAPWTPVNRTSVLCLEEEEFYLP